MVDSDIARAGRDKRRATQNININPRDYGKLMLGGQPGVTGGNNIPGILGMLGDQAGTQNSPGFGLRKYESDSVVQPQVPRQKQQPGSDSIQAILAQLQQLISGQGQQGPRFQPMELPQFDPNRYKGLATQSVNSQFNPIIQQILAGQKQTQGRANTNRGIVGGLYQGAVQDINTGAAQTQRDYDAAQAQSKQLYVDERNRIAAGYAADAAAQRKEAQRLGTEALGDNGASAQQAADRQFADQLGSQQMQSSQAAYGQQEAAAGQYNKSIANATRAEGIEAQSDIMRQLEDYMAQSNSDLADTRAQQAGSISDLMMKLAGAGYDRDAANAQFQYQQQRDYLGDQRDLADRQQDLLMAQLEAAQSGQAASSEKLNPYQSVATFADQLRPGQGQDFVAAIQAAMNGRPEIYARHREDPVQMNPALFAKLIADYPGNEDMDRNTLMMVSQELYRLLYGT
jgi:hypothetical protein